MRMRSVTTVLLSLWLAASSALAVTNRALMVESEGGTQALPTVSIKLLSGMAVINTTGVSRVGFNSTGDTYLAIQADLMDVVSPAVTNLYLNQSVLRLTVGGGSNPVLRLGETNMDIQLAVTNPVNAASIPSKWYVDNSLIGLANTNWVTQLFLGTNVGLTNVLLGGESGTVSGGVAVVAGVVRTNTTGVVSLTNRSSRISCRGLDINIAETTFFEQSVVSNGIECHSSGETEIIFAGYFFNIFYHSQK